MFVAHVVVSILLALALAYSASCDFTRKEEVLVAMAKTGVPESWLNRLGVLKAAAAAGLMVGLAVPLIGAAAAAGVVLYFVGAVITHLRARDYTVAPAGLFGVIAVAALILGLATL